MPPHNFPQYYVQLFMQKGQNIYAKYSAAHRNILDCSGIGASYVNCFGQRCKKQVSDDSDQGIGLRWLFAVVIAELASGREGG